MSESGLLRVDGSGDGFRIPWSKLTWITFNIWEMFGFDHV